MVIGKKQKKEFGDGKAIPPRERQPKFDFYQNREVKVMLSMI
jgi:hypothetical protein